MRLKLPVVTVLLLAAAPVWAHHGSAGFDQNKPIHLVGKVGLLEWTNPHIVIHVEVAGADGNLTTWLVNTIPPNAALRSGFSKNSFASGMDITVDGYQAADGSNHVNGTNIVLPDGKKIVSPACFTDEPGCFKPYDGKGYRIQ
jgi:hypothetical protein